MTVKRKVIPLRPKVELKEAMAHFAWLVRHNFRASMPDELSEGIIAYFLNAERVTGNGDLRLSSQKIAELKVSASVSEAPSSVSPKYDRDHTLLFAQFSPDLTGRFTLWVIPNEHIIVEVGKRAKNNFKKVIRDFDIKPTAENVGIWDDQVVQ